MIDQEATPPWVIHISVASHMEGELDRIEDTNPSEWNPLRQAIMLEWIYYYVLEGRDN